MSSLFECLPPVSWQMLILRSSMDRGDAPQNQGNNLHVSGLAKSVDIPMLEDVFGKIGKVSCCESCRRHRR